MTAEGLEEYVIEEILDEQCQGRGHEENCWLPRCELEECQALNVWLNGVGGKAHV